MERLNEIFQSEKVKISKIQLKETESFSIPEIKFNLEDDEINKFLYVPYKKKDRSCILSRIHYSKKDFEIVKLEESNSAEEKLGHLVAFLNRKMKTDRKINGELDEYGLFKERIMNGLQEAKKYEQCETIQAGDLTEEIFFNQYVLKSKPLLIKGSIKKWDAIRKWNNDQYFEVQKERVGVKVVPRYPSFPKLVPENDILNKSSEVDAPYSEKGAVFEGCEPIEKWRKEEDEKIPERVAKELESIDKVVVRPAHIYLPSFSSFFHHLDLPHKSSSFYLEYTSLSSFPKLVEDVSSFDFASFLNLQSSNIWFGDGKTVGKLHFDPFENLISMIEGSKTFVLFHPFENKNLYEGHIRQAFLDYDIKSDQFKRDNLDTSTSMVMSPIDINSPDLERYPLFKDAIKINCTVSKGETLFVPSFWWHEVYSRDTNRENRNIAVNYWYHPMFTKEFPCKECPFELNEEHYSSYLQEELFKNTKDNQITSKTEEII